MIVHVRAIFRLCILILYTFYIVSITHILNHICSYSTHRKFLQRWYVNILKLFGFTLHIEGSMPKKQGMLIITNHSSYMDILVIGSLFFVHFTPKSNIKTWPFISQMVGASQPIYINRNDRRAIATQNVKIANFIKSGKNVVLYPEGTTSTGIEVYPFKTGFFAFLEAPEHRSIPVLPVTIVYKSANDIPLTKHTPSPIAWYGDESLLPHLWKLLKQTKAEVKVILHEPVTMENFNSRKELAQHCEEMIRKDLDNILHKV